ncbi:uncharacterized protein RAG0_06123 [Rhynchosporium agropyri]|uniref:Uncharacterized protein n=1 Tax=Rhynchosporium agropyri TaxID=914238 RepID=A0A1E1KG47_9HELO|nr:uncharacterized protein RAG0_06123 [Rhynchosporium agropyri]
MRGSTRPDNAVKVALPTFAMLRAIHARASIRACKTLHTYLHFTSAVNSGNCSAISCDGHDRSKNFRVRRCVTIASNFLFDGLMSDAYKSLSGKTGMAWQEAEPERRSISWDLQKEVEIQDSDKVDMMCYVRASQRHLAIEPHEDNIELYFSRGTPLLRYFKPKLDHLEIDSESSRELSRSQPRALGNRPHNYLSTPHRNGYRQSRHINDRACKINIQANPAGSQIPQFACLVACYAEGCKKELVTGRKRRRGCVKTRDARVFKDSKKSIAKLLITKNHFRKERNA